MHTHRSWTFVAFASLALVVASCNCGSNPAIGTEDGGEQGGGEGGGVGGGAGGGGGDDGGTFDDGGVDAGVDAGVDGGTGPCTAPVSCYSGPAGTMGVGACRAGVQQCINGVLGPCTGEVDPSAESCNSADDDCDGTSDEVADLGSVSCGVGECAVTVNACTNGSPTTCTPGAAVTEICGNNKDDDCDGVIDDGCPCGFYVSPTGNDSNTGTTVTPMRTISAAITAAAASSGLNKTVCVASGANAPSTFDYAEAVVMKSGVSVQGGYITNGSAAWTHPGLAGGANTRITAQNAKGLLFDVSVVSPTGISDFQLVGQSATNSSAAVTVEGSTGAIISDNVITGGSTSISYGIDVVDSGGTKATPQILRNAIIGGSGTQLSAGIHSLNSAPNISSQCTTFDAQGRCNAFGCAAGTALSIRGRNFGSNGLDSYGVILDSSPGAIISANAICPGPGSTNPAGVSVGVLIKGDATGTQVRTSNISGNNAGSDSVAVWLQACAGAAPWIFDNFRIGGSSGVVGSRGDGVRAVGNCNPRIDSNLLIVGGEEGSNSPANGVLCARDVDAGISSLCTVLGNKLIRGSTAGYPPVSTGVQCEAGACARIENNALITGQQGITSVGVALNNSSAFVNNNLIEAGCANGASGYGAGVVSTDSPARLQNNVIGGSSATSACPANATNTYAVRVFNGPNGNELDLHSNDLFARGKGNATCTGRALTFDASDAGVAAGPRGVVRNNILHSGACSTAIDLEEASASADPRILENNDFFGATNADGGFGTSLYLDEAANNLTTAAAINALTDVTAANNLSADPLFSGAANFHIPAASPARNTGTNTSCPSTDFDGDSRPKENVCDIGADEYVP